MKKGTQPYTHNLNYLAGQSGIDVKMAEEQKDFIDLLEPLNVVARDPTHKERLMRSLNEERCKEIIQGTKGVLHGWTVILIRAPMRSILCKFQLPIGRK
ncbi:MAG: HEPN domain-containing protein [Deltaproteobacteria bacterium]|nr:HEPN domain-containing protein [Deltaproteobacteria bacterium]